MKNTFNSSNFHNKSNSTKITSDNSNINYHKGKFQKYLNLGETLFIDKKFDIKHYLENAKTKYIFNSIEKSKNILNNNSSKNFKNESSFNNISKNDNKPSIYELNLNKDNKKTSKLNLPSISMNISNYSISNIYKPKSNYSISNTNYNFSTMKSPKIPHKINSRYNSYSNKTYAEEDNKIFKVKNVIKSIKLKEKNFDFKSYLNKTKNFYEKKNALIALDSDLVLKNFRKNKKTEETEDIPISTFITQRKEISINNLLIKLMHTESNKLQKKEQKISKEIKKEKKEIEQEHLKLDEYTDTQKIECKKIEFTLTELIKKHENLIREEQELLLDVKVKEFEIYKILININLYRFFAKLCNTILEGNPSRFEKQILPDYHEFDKIDLEPIIEEVIKNYSDIQIKVIERNRKTEYKYLNFVDENKDKKNIVKYKGKEGYFLYNPEFLYLKYNEIEGNILRLLTTKEQLIVTKLKKEKENNEALSYLIDRCRDLQTEYDNLCIEYKQEKKKYEHNLIERGISDNDEDSQENIHLIQDLYSCAIEVLEKPLLSLCKINKTNFVQYNNFNNRLFFEELVKYGRSLVKNLEINLNILLNQIRNERKEDRNIFDKVIKDIKIYYKIIRQNSFEKSKAEENQIKKFKMMEKHNDIKMLYRKDEPPYYKKRKQKVEIDYDLIRNEENKELITYH